MTEMVYKPEPSLIFATVTEQMNDVRCLLTSHDKKDHLNLDLSAVNRCDSAGLAMLIEIKRLCKEFSTSYSVSLVPNHISALATFYGVEKEVFKSNE